jgi:transcriptional regulator with XRE-family HTH domain
MSTIVAIEELGRRIRKLRTDRRLTLKQVEHSSGLSATHLSEIERGRTSPTIGALVRIARALDKDAAYFIEPDERPDVSHQTAGSGHAEALALGASASGLSPGIPGGRLFAYRVTLEPSSPHGLRLEAQDFPGEATYLIRQGRVEASLGDASLDLGPGDAAQASLSIGHQLRASGGPAEMLVLLSRRLPDRAG